MRVVFYWEAAGLSMTRGNPYGGLLANALAELGVEMVAGFADDLTEAWLHENQGKVDVLHLNWPNTMYAAPELSERVSKCMRLISNLQLARSLGYKVVWTVHNLYPHERASPDLDRLLQLALTSVATALIAHCNHARELVREHFYRIENVFVIPHGHFIEPYPNTVSRAEAREQLGVPQDSFVYLFFGNARPYKGIENFLEAFAQIPGDDLRLLLAAKVYSDYGQTLTAQAADIDARILVRPSSFYANEELQVQFNAADVVVLPFLNVLTSGSTITALGFSKPVVVPAIGCLPELVDDAVGMLYDPAQPNALVDAMRTIRDRDIPSLSQAAFERAKSLDWENIARQTLAAYHV